MARQVCDVAYGKLFVDFNFFFLSSVSVSVRSIDDETTRENLM